MKYAKIGTPIFSLMSKKVILASQYCGNLKIV